MVRVLMGNVLSMAVERTVLASRDTVMNQDFHFTGGGKQDK